MSNTVITEELQELQGIVARCLAKAGPVLGQLSKLAGTKPEATYLQEALRQAQQEIADDSQSFWNKYTSVFLRSSSGKETLSVQEGITLARVYNEALEMRSKNDTLHALAQKQDCTPQQMQLAIVKRLLRRSTPIVA